MSQSKFHIIQKLRKVSGGYIYVLLSTLYIEVSCFPSDFILRVLPLFINRTYFSGMPIIFVSPGKHLSDYLSHLSLTYQIT